MPELMNLSGGNCLVEAFSNGIHGNNEIGNNNTQIGNKTEIGILEMQTLDQQAFILLG
jgi:hypothetical protein